MTSSIDNSPREFGLKNRVMFYRVFSVFGITTFFPLMAFIADASRKGVSGFSKQWLVVLFCLLTPLWLICAVFVWLQKKYRLKIFKDRISLNRAGFSEVLEIGEIERFQFFTGNRVPDAVEFIPKPGLNKSTIVITNYCEGFEAVQVWARNARIREG